MKKADPSFIYGFKIIYNNKYKNIWQIKLCIVYLNSG
jgi:hypothetical protein